MCPPPSGNPVAAGDGCRDDTAAIQAGLDALKRSDALPDTCSKTASLDAWPVYASTLYLPAGIYRITARLIIPFCQHVRIVGDGGRGGGYTAGSGRIIPVGTLIRQDTDDEPILVFQNADTQSWAIDGIGFTWKAPQEPPAGWMRPLDDSKQVAPGATEPGACGILFSGVTTTPPDPPTARTDYYHGRISNCPFTDGWRGISFDDSFTQGAMSVWDTRMEGLTMLNMKGAGLSLVAANGGIGMPINSFRNSFIDNPQRENVEDRIQIAQQGAFLLENVTLEHSSTRAISCTDCTMTMRNVSVEHAMIKRPLGQMVYFGGGSYVVEMFGFDGWMDSGNPDGTQGFSVIINADGTYPNPTDERAIGNPTTVVLSNVRALPLLPSALDPDVGGFAPLNGPTVLLAGASNTEYVVLNAPNLPVFPELRRTTEWDDRPTGGTGGQTYKDLYGRYRELVTFSNGLGETMSSVVKMPETKKTVRVPLGTVPARTLGTVQVSLVTSLLGAPPPGQPRARPGDLVRLGPPGTFPAGLTASGVVVVPDTVDVRVFNTTVNPVTVPNALWTIEVSGGPDSGAEQLIPDQPFAAESSLS